MSEVVSQFRLIAALADTARDNMWADDLAARCRQIREALAVIEQEINSRRAGER